jgi:hypothetical protein
MQNHNPKRFIITTLAAVAVAGAALLPGVASADGGPKPRPQGAQILGTTYGGDGQLGLVATTYGRGLTGDSNGDGVVDAADYVVLKAPARR